MIRPARSINTEAVPWTLTFTGTLYGEELEVTSAQGPYAVDQTAVYFQINDREEDMFVLSLPNVIDLVAQLRAHIDSMEAVR